MPELPEVESLAAFLRERAIGHVITRIDVLAISALKTYDPPIHALHGLTEEVAARHHVIVNTLDDAVERPGHRGGRSQGREEARVARPWQGRAEVPGLWRRDP